MDQSPNLHLPFIMPMQAQKHITYNEAMVLLDTLVQLSVESRDFAAPPASPAEGARYIVATGATGAWAGHAGDLAIFTDAAWSFSEPPDGTLAWLRDDGYLVVRAGTGWTPFAESLADLTPDLLGINAAASSGNRLSLSSAGSLFSHEGSSHRMAINKANAADTASVIFQRGFSGRAEIGLTGDDDLRVKVSADGSAWTNALSVARSSGRVTAHSGLAAAGHILQVRGGTLGTTFTTNSATAQPTGVKVTITPTSTSSKVLVRASVHVGAEYWNTCPRVAIFRDGAKVFPAHPAVMLEHQLLADTSSNSKLVSQTLVLEFIDSPASTSTLTYEVFMASATGGYNSHVNRREYATDARGESTIIAMEIGV